MKEKEEQIKRKREIERKREKRRRKGIVREIEREEGEATGAEGTQKREEKVQKYSTLVAEFA